MDLISRQAAIDALNNLNVSDGVGISSIACSVQESAISAIQHLPSADVQQVRHGHWTLWEGDITFWLKCSECGKDVLPTYPHFYFCPRCGARMDGEEDDKK